MNKEQEKAHKEYCQAIADNICTAPTSSETIEGMSRLIKGDSSKFDDNRKRRKELQKNIYTKAQKFADTHYYEKRSNGNKHS